MGAMSNPVYDLHRYGIHFDASPRHADLLMVTGTVTRNLEQALRMAYEAMPEPRLVMACGACAAGGETYGSSYAIVGAADKVVPVDLYVPGCPPRPSAMMAGLLAAADMLAEKL
jgi:Ni,Fe-hydrogenase III small subunit